MQYVLMRMIFAFILIPYTAFSFAEYPDKWDTASSIDRALHHAPQLQVVKAEIEARQIRLDEADNWPNPRVSVAVDNKASLEQGGSSYALGKLDVIQPLPIGRLGAETRQASIALTAAQSLQRFRLLEVEMDTARVFYTLQYRTELLSLAEQKYESLVKLLRGRKDPLVRFFTQTERKRLTILREQAHQAMSAAEGEYREALSKFRTLLALPESYKPVVNALQPIPAPKQLDVLLAIQMQHPLLISLQHSELAAKSDIDVARASRYVDPELLLFSERDVYAGRVQVSTGVALMVEMPLWQSSDRKVARARAKFYKEEAQLKIQQRDLNSRLRKNHVHLNHLIEQAKHYQDDVLVPAREILELSQRGFRSGEIDMLNFIDAHNTYYDAQAKYLKLLYEGWLETAELRYSSGELYSEVIL